MSGFRGRLAFWNVASVLVTGVADVLEETTGGAVDRACVVPGEVAWDECDCGLLAVSPRRFFVSDEFPEGALGRGLVRDSPCDQPWLVAEIFVQVIRCVPSPSEGQLSVPCDALADAAQVLLEDSYVTLTETVRTLCEMVADDEIVDYVLGEQVTRGPEGGCVGTELNVFVAVDR